MQADAKAAVQAPGNLELGQKILPFKVEMAKSLPQNATLVRCSVATIVVSAGTDDAERQCQLSRPLYLQPMPVKQQQHGLLG